MIYEESIAKRKHPNGRPNAEPTIPQPATVLLVRDSKDEGVEVFLVERASKASLAAFCISWWKSGS